MLGSFMELANAIALLAPRTALVCVHSTNSVSPNAPYTAGFAKWNNLQHFVAILNIHIYTMYDKISCFINNGLLHGCNFTGDKKGTARKSLFTPRTNDMFTSWYNIMSTKNIKINRNSRVCELHFKSEDIIKEDVFMQADGKIIYVIRKNPKLKEEAVPLIFPIKKTPYFEPME
ncbi:hypothetical protein ALC53_12675 [Atta colombica]|uniref:THAP-type domain-containing protein n=1 Tax=Atta colombica TaxID=520822 RepID=A0A151HZA0_9HYME|nr:hypothetical protein ALC53_12675 [Atta colombica]